MEEAATKAFESLFFLLQITEALFLGVNTDIIETWEGGKKVIISTIRLFSIVGGGNMRVTEDNRLNYIHIDFNPYVSTRSYHFFFLLTLAKTLHVK